SASAILGMPELAEKRTVTGTSFLKCNALLTLAASALGTNLPSSTTPLAWADRCVVCLPNAELSASTNVSVVVAMEDSFRVLVGDGGRAEAKRGPSRFLKARATERRARPLFCLLAVRARGVLLKRRPAAGS